jgi:hypothetical protein
MKARALSCASLWLCLLAACSRPTPGEPAKVDEQTATPPASGTAMAVTINKLVNAQGEETTESMKTFEGPTLALIEEKFNAIDWNDAKLRPTVGLTQRDMGKLKSTLKIARPRDSGPTKSLQAQWIVYENGEMRVSPPFDTPTAGLTLLKAYFQQDDKLNELVKWSKAE